MVTVTTTQTTTINSVGFSTSFVNGHNNTSTSTTTSSNTGNTTSTTTAAKPEEKEEERLVSSQSPPVTPSANAEENVKVCNECLEYRNLVSQAYYSLEDISGSVENLGDLFGRRLNEGQTISDKVRESLDKFNAPDRREIEKCLA